MDLATKRKKTPVCTVCSEPMELVKDLGVKKSTSGAFDFEYVWVRRFGCELCQTQTTQFSPQSVPLLKEQKAKK